MRESAAIAAASPNFAIPRAAGPKSRLFAFD
jgi:hypothetical protein